MTVPVIALLYCNIPLTLFVLIFGMADWHKTVAGKAIMGFAFACTVVLWMSFARQIGFPPPTWARIPAFLFLGSMFWFFFISFLYIQRRGRQRELAKLSAEREDREVDARH